MSLRPSFSRMAGILLVASGLISPASAAEPARTRRKVLVELYTSQGCDMCPAAEKILGELASKNRSVVPVAFHVDYFNEPWHDVFSDPVYSERQKTYHQNYTGPKDPNLGLYYTPMLMIDGQTPVNGRDPAAADAAIRRALEKKAAVGLTVALDRAADGRSGTATITVTSQSPRAEDSPLLVCAVLREDGVVTRIGSGENAGKSLTARFPARISKYDTVDLRGKSYVRQRFPIAIEPTWNREKLRLAVFVQDKATLEIHQATDLPWLPAAESSSPASSNAKSR